MYLKRNQTVLLNFDRKHVINVMQLCSGEQENCRLHWRSVSESKFQVIRFLGTIFKMGVE
jgi:hypothetical protein